MKKINTIDTLTSLQIGDKILDKKCGDCLYVAKTTKLVAECGKILYAKLVLVNFDYGFPPAFYDYDFDFQGNIIPELLLIEKDDMIGVATVNFLENTQQYLVQ